MKKALVILASTLVMSGAFAQASAPAVNPAEAAAAAKPTHEARVEERIAYLHAQLKITPAQETQWTQFAGVMRENGQTMDKLYRQRMSGAKQSALDDMKQYAQIAQAHADGTKKLVGAFEPLYGNFSPEQKQLADTAFRTALAPEHRKHHAGAKSAQPASNESAAKQ
jgi:protein CpxP